MPDPRILELLEEAIDSGRTPEEVCAAAPELLTAVRQRWENCRRLEAQFEDLFPSSSASAPSAGSSSAGSSADGGGSKRRRAARLPRVPGYEVESVLGQGGMGVVYRARHLGLNRAVALKMLLSGPYSSPMERARLVREAQAVAALRHAHVVQVHDVGEVDGRPYFTMELVEGGSLAERLGGVPQPAAAAAAMLATLADAVHAAHRSGIVHRDLKPGNVLLMTDGTPKVSDFGLARRVEAAGAEAYDPALTISGARVGTPSYMAPEQAAGRRGTVGPAADVYALGAILYEMLTGRPPFRGESAAETERQLLTEEPAPPSRLNARVPRDLETICLKCLSKDPARRYASAAALAADARRFGAGEPIAARRVGPVERSLRWARRHPAVATALAGGALIAGLLVVGGVWLALVRAERRHAVEVDLRDVTQLQDQARWAAARTALERAEARVGAAGPADLRPRFDRARHDLDLVIRLDTVRLVRVTRGEPAIYRAQADRAYGRAFRDAGLIDGTGDGDGGDAPARVAGRVRESAVRAALVTALDDWIVCAADKGRRGWLIDVARAAEPDPGGWRARVLDAGAWDDPAAVADLAAAAPLEGPPLSLLLVLAERIKASGGDPADFLKRAQAQHPADFWANLILGNHVMFRAPHEATPYERLPREAEGYYRAALASRPDAAVGYCVVGDALRLQGSFDAALHYYDLALAREPNYARAYTNIGLTLQQQGQIDRAIDSYRRAIPLDPEYAWTHFELANALRAKGQLDDAADHYRQAARLDPGLARAAEGVRGVLLLQGRGATALAEWRAALAADPRAADDWIGYAQLSLFLGRADEYRWARGQLLDRFGDGTDPALGERASRACLLMPLDGDDLRRAAALADRAAGATGAVGTWAYHYFLFAKGLAEYRAGHFEGAIAIMDGGAAAVIGPGPRLVRGMAQQRLGRSAAARQSLAAAVVSFDWSPMMAEARDHWIWHVLRREAEGLILPQIAEFRAGAYWPPAGDADERLALTGACQADGLNARAARLYAEALATKSTTKPATTPAIGGDAAAPLLRLNAARFAALAAGGQGADAAALGDAERARWRAAARAWLAEELDACEAARGGSGVRSAVHARLSRWAEVPELAPIRDAPGLPAEERAACAALWARLQTLLDRARLSNAHAQSLR